LNRGSL